MREAAHYFQGGELTGQYLPSGERRTPVRPLGNFSDFVAKILPSRLEQLQSGMYAQETAIADMENYATHLLVSRLPRLGTRDYAIGRLDVMMAYAGLAHRGVRIGEQFSRLIEYFSEHDLPTLTYETIVMDNPSGDPRTFTHGAAGSDEASFYQLHQDLERPMESLVAAVREFVRRGPRATTAKIEQHMQALGILFANTRSSGRGMTHFNDFRGYLNGIPETMLGSTLEQKTYGGPSGAFSPTVHELDLLLCGIAGDSELAEYVEINRAYFPATSRNHLDGAIALTKQGRSIIDYVRNSGYNPQLVTLARNLLQPLANFRAAHLRAVQNQVPELFVDETAAGTGGIASSVPFLRHRLEKIKQLLGELDEHSTSDVRRRTHAK